jgi:hypothetical protein
LIDQTIERPLPSDSRAELAVLGSVILDNSALRRVANQLNADNFYDRRHRVIFSAMLQLETKAQPIDTITLLDHLTSLGQLESAGGAIYLNQLADGLPRVTNIEHYSGIVRERAALRELISWGHEIYEAGFASSHAIDAEAILQEANDRLAKFRELAQITSWRNKFHTVEELPDGEIVFLIDQILPEGVTFIGGLSGVGKTWFALSIARALTAGRKFLGVWNVPEAVNVLYLCPEMNARAFRRRCKRLGIGGERFRCITISDGAPLDLGDRVLLTAVRELKPTIILDTAIRFSNADDENSASDNQGLARSIFALIHAGARAVICLHHRGKDAGRDEMTLENCLRGTSDLGVSL